MFNGTFSTNRRAIGVINISHRAGGEHKHIIQQSHNETINTLQPGLCGDDPLATVRLPQRSLSSESLGKY